MNDALKDKIKQIKKHALGFLSCAEINRLAQGEMEEEEREVE